MTTTSDKWYTTKILSSLLIVMLLMIFILNQSFKSEYVLPESPKSSPIEIIEFQREVDIIEEKSQPKKAVKKISKITSTEIKIVKEEPKLKPVELVKNIVIDSSQFIVELRDTVVEAIGEPTVSIEKKAATKEVTKIPNSKPLDWSEEMPEYPGGKNALRKFLSRKLNYPVYEHELGMEGTVVTSFVVSTDGSIDNIEVISSPSEGFTREAKSVISKMSRWKPGYHNGNAVAVKYTLPLRFRLN